MPQVQALKSSTLTGQLEMNRITFTWIELTFDGTWPCTVITQWAAVRPADLIILEKKETKRELSP